MVSPRVAIVTDEPGWHGQELQREFSARGFNSTYVSLAECRFDLDESGHIVLPGFEHYLPAGVFVRGIPAGTLEQITLRLDILHGLRELGVMVYNDARAIERTVDKAMTSFLLKRAGLPTPDTWVCESTEQARAIVERELAGGRSIVIKPLFGSQGVGLTLIEHLDALPEVEKFNGVYYLQSFIDRGQLDWYDWRVFIIGGHAQAAMVRRNHHWITNRARGARCEPATLDSSFADLAEEAARAVDVDYAGVDLLQDKQGRTLIIEVNSIPAWRGLQEVCSVNIAERLVDRFLSQMVMSGVVKAGP